MGTTSQQILNIIPLISEEHAQKILDIMRIVLPSEILQESAFDAYAINEISTNPDCKEYVSGADAYAMLGWD